MQGGGLAYEILTLGSKLEASSSEQYALRQKLLEVTDWESLLDRAIGTHLAPILHRSISRLEDQTMVPSEIRQTLKASYDQVLARNIQLEKVFGDFVRLLNEHGISLIPLKGIYLSEAVYKDAGLRHLSDIDVLVKEPDLDQICDLMSARGWQVKNMLKRSSLEDKFFRHAHPRTLIKGGLIIELHTHLYNSDQAAELTTAALWHDARQESFLGVSIQQLSTEMLLQHTCMHLHKHLLSHELKVLNFCDIREILRVRSAVFNWQRFQQLAQQHGCINEVEQVLYLSSKYWNVEVPLEFGVSSASTLLAEEKYWSFMTGLSTTKTAFLKNRLNKKISNYNHLESRTDKVRFLIGFVFPKADFMRQRYSLQQRSWLFPWYGYRVMELSIKAIRATFSPSEKSS